jgi:hypothetical protein
MVELHTHQPARLIVVKPARSRRSAPLSRAPSCLWPGCNAHLAGDHSGPVCSCHAAPAKRIPHHRSDRLVLHLLLSAYPEAVDLCAVLHCTSHELEPTLKRLRRRCHVIVGARRGYVYEVGDSQWR